MNKILLVLFTIFIVLSIFYFSMKNNCEESENYAGGGHGGGGHGGGGHHGGGHHGGGRGYGGWSMGSSGGWPWYYPYYPYYTYYSCPDCTPTPTPTSASDEKK